MFSVSIKKTIAAISIGSVISLGLLARSISATEPVTITFPDLEVCTVTNGTRVVNSPVEARTNPGAYWFDSMDGRRSHVISNSVQIELHYYSTAAGMFFSRIDDEVGWIRSSDLHGASEHPCLITSDSGYPSR